MVHPSLSLSLYAIHNSSPLDLPVFVTLNSLSFSSWHQIATDLSDMDIQWITAGFMPAVRTSPLRPHTTASDPGPILLPHLIGQPWLLSTPSHSIPWADAHPAIPGTHRPVFAAKFLHQPKRIQGVLLLRDGHAINPGPWVFLLGVKTCWAVRKAKVPNSQECRRCREGG